MLAMESMDDELLEGVDSVLAGTSLVVIAGSDEEGDDDNDDKVPLQEVCLSDVFWACP